MQHVHPVLPVCHHDFEPRPWSLELTILSALSTSSASSDCLATCFFDPHAAAATDTIIMGEPSKGADRAVLLHTEGNRVAAQALQPCILSMLRWFGELVEPADPGTPKMVTFDQCEVCGLVPARTASNAIVQ